MMRMTDYITPAGEQTVKRQYMGSWRMEGGRCAESWCPQRRDTAPGDAPPDTLPALSWLDEQISGSRANEEIKYMDALLRRMAGSAPASTILREDMPLPEIVDAESGNRIETTFEHISDWIRGKSFGGRDLHLRHENRYHVVSLSCDEEPKRQCRIAVEAHSPGQTAQTDAATG
jgi:hypothetical protein